jgi:hypothetical protein
LRDEIRAASGRKRPRAAGKLRPRRAKDFLARLPLPGILCRVSAVMLLRLALLACFGYASSTLAVTCTTGGAHVPLAGEDVTTNGLASLTMTAGTLNPEQRTDASGRRRAGNLGRNDELDQYLGDRRSDRHHRDGTPEYHRGNSQPRVHGDVIATAISRST